MQERKKTLIIDPRLAGISGDMLVAALASLGGGETRQAFNKFARSVLAELKLVNSTFEIRETVVNGIAGYRVYQDLREDLKNRSFAAIRENLQQIASLETLSRRAADFANNTLNLLVNAEARVHGKEPGDTKGHFHELGSVDTILDICGVAYLMDLLEGWEADIITLPVNTGSGTVEIAHGKVTVPVPAVVEIFTRRGIVIFSDDTPAELVTPTGAALLTALITRANACLPAFKSGNHGVGHGTRKTARHNYLQVLSGQLLHEMISTDGFTEDEVTVMETHVDDVTGESIGVVINKLFNAGALDATVIPYTTKKNRTGWSVKVIADHGDVEHLSIILFKHLRTLGICTYVTRRVVLERHFRREIVEIGGKKHAVRVKVAGTSNNPFFSKIEHDDLQAIAEELDISLQEAREMVTGLIGTNGEIAEKEMD